MLRERETGRKGHPRDTPARQHKLVAERPPWRSHPLLGVYGEAELTCSGEPAYIRNVALVASAGMRAERNRAEAEPESIGKRAGTEQEPSGNPADAERNRAEPSREPNGNPAGAEQEPSGNRAGDQREPGGN